jgi:hypothetical protein
MTSMFPEKRFSASRSGGPDFLMFSRSQYTVADYAMWLLIFALAFTAGAAMAKQESAPFS